jgi:hypothetical protein
MKTTASILGLALSLPLAAQSLESVDPATSDASIAAPEATADKTSELIAVPSRYVGIDADAYVQTILSSFEMRSRARDPFGRHQDPNFKPPTPVIAKKAVKKYKPEPVTPFSDIVEAIPITAIIPAQGKFLVGGRAFSVGSRLKLNTGKDEPLTVHVVGIDQNRVNFRHGVTNETAAHVLKVLPGGMIRGGGEARPDGIIPANADDTIDLSGSSPNSLSSRR